MAAMYQMPMSRQMQVCLQQARKRNRKRAEATVGKGGMRAQRPGLGLSVKVKLTTQ